MTNTYHIPVLFAYGEQDVFENGCIPGTAFDYSYEQSFDAINEAALIESVLVHFNVERDAITLNACDEDGRLDICRMECEDGTQAGPAELESWKRGNKKLFNVTYTGHLEIKTPAKFTL